MQKKIKQYWKIINKKKNQKIRGQEEGYIVNSEVRADTWDELSLGTSPHFQDCIHI